MKANESYFAEPQYKIDKCLACERAECTDCLSGRSLSGSGRGRRTKNYDPENLRNLMSSGLKDAEICIVLQISRRTLMRYKKRILNEKNISMDE